MLRRGAERFCIIGNTYSGLCEDGNIDVLVPGGMVCEQGSVPMGANERHDGQIGEILLAALTARTGCGPAEEVRGVSVQGNPQLEAGLLRGRVNRRGTLDGGLCKAFSLSPTESMRRMNARWPRTAAILCRLGQRIT